MKIFTKIILWIAGILLVVSACCFLIAAGMGFNKDSFKDMVKSGKLTFDFGENFAINFGGSNNSVSSSDTVNYTDITAITDLEIEYGAGEFAIRYEDTDKISVKANNVIGFETKVKNGTLIVKGDLSTNFSGDSSLVIILPEGFSLNKVDLELGASAATVNGLKANSLEVEIGAGAATFTNLDVSNLNAEVGLGQLNLNLVESEEDYSYQLECGIGEINFNGNSYAGFGSSTTVNKDGATRRLNIECGIGEVNVKFNK